MNTIDLIQAALDENPIPKQDLQALPVEIMSGRPIHYIKAKRAASRLSRLFTVEGGADILAEISAHQDVLTELGFRAPRTLKECRELLEKLGD